MSESYKIEITTTAKAEAQEAKIWLRQFSDETAERFMEGLVKAVTSLQMSPFRCPIAPENEFFYEEIRQLIYGKYRILITIDEATVYVLHVRHSSQRFVRQPMLEDDE